MNLIWALPATSRLTEALHGETWTTTDHLIASLIDLTAAAHSGGKAKPFPRPGMGERIGRDAMTAEQYAEWRKTTITEGDTND